MDCPLLILIWHLFLQFNLFGGTVLKLGTERHHNKLLKGIDNLQDIGCFGLTELGYGNNAVEMETTAIYDSKTKEFIVNTPHPLAQKYWITNGAVHAKHVVVMAKLIGTDASKSLNIVIIKYSLLDSVWVLQRCQFSKILINTNCKFSKLWA